MAIIKQTPRDYYNEGPYGSSQFTDLQSIIDQFIIAYVGEDKIIPKIKRTDVMFHAKRGMQELSFDVFKSCKSLEILLPPTLQMILPQDYVNYTKVSWVDGAGIKRIIYPTSKTSNPKSYYQNDDGEFKITAIGTFTNNSATLTLDDEYKEITTGMINDIVPFKVKDVSTSGGVTTITLAGNANFSGNRKVSFYSPGGQLPRLVDESVVLTGMSWLNNSNYITAASSSDADKIKVGMVCSHDDFGDGTSVIDVQGTSIYLSGNTQAVGTSENVSFVSYKDSNTWEKYKSGSPIDIDNDNDYKDDYWPLASERYGLDPQYAQANGSYYIDCQRGIIHFSSNLSGKTIVLDYLSDSLTSTDKEIQVHKFAEEAMYKWIAYAILSTSSNQIHQQLAPRFKREKAVEVRRAKLRLSNIKLEEITQIFRGKSKHIKH
jgi:hypothetical protein